MSCALLFLTPPAWAATGASSRESEALGIAHYILGVRHDLLGENDLAVREYAQTVRVQDKVFLPRLRLGMAYAREGASAKAIDALTAASRIDPEDLQSHYFLALVYSSQKDIPKATREYEMILNRLTAEDPRNAELFSYLGNLYFLQGQDDKGLEQFERVIALEPKNTGALYLVAIAYLEDNRRVEAVELLKRCVAEDPMDDGCLNSLSYTYAEDGANLEEALGFVNRALEVRPDYPAYLDTRGWVYYHQEKYMEALKDLARAADLAQDPIIQDHLGDVSLKLNNLEAARGYWQESLSLDPDQLNVRSKLESLGKKNP